MSEEVDTSADFSDAAIQSRWSNGFGQQEPPTPEPEVTPEPKQEAPPEPKADEPYIPKKFLGQEDAPPPSDEEDMLKFEPKGQISHKHFKKLQDQSKGEIEKERQLRTQFEKELTELKGKYTDDYVPEGIKKQLETERKLREERDQELAKVAVERTEEFKDRFTSKISSLKGALNKAKEQFGLDEDMIPRLLSASLKRRAEILSETELNHVAVSHINNLLDRHDEIESDKASYLENWEANLSKSREREAAESDARLAKQKEYEDKVLETTMDHFRKTYAPLQRIDGDEKWNAMVDQNEADIKRYFSGQFTTEEYAKLAIAGVTAPKVYQMYEKAVGDLKAAVAELNGLKAANPTAPNVNGRTPATDDSKLTQQERWMQSFDRITASAANNGFTR